MARQAVLVSAAVMMAAAAWLTPAVAAATPPPDDDPPTVLPPPRPSLCDSSGVEQFSDVDPDDYAAEYILCMRALGLSAGMGDGNYGPDRELTRGQMAAFIARLWQDVLGEECPSGPSPFTDVPSDHTFRTGIDCIFNLGITKGYYDVGVPHGIRLPDGGYYYGRKVEDAGARIDDLAPSTTYTFKVRACMGDWTADGPDEGNCSEWAEVVVTTAASSTSAIDAPNPPAGVAAMAGPRWVGVEWDRVPGVIEYKILLDGEPHVTWHFLEDDVTEYRFHGLRPGTGYRVGVMACRSERPDFACSDAREVSVTTEQADASAPPGPLRNLRVGDDYVSEWGAFHDAVTDTQVRFEWDEMPGVTEYPFELSDWSYGRRLNPFNGDFDGTTDFLADRLSPNTTYTLRIKACWPDWNSPPDLVCGPESSVTATTDP